MIDCYFHVNMKVQTAMCKDNNNSKSRPATYVKFDIWNLTKAFALLVNLRRRTTIINFLISCNSIRPECDLFWSKLFSHIETKATLEADVIINFLRNLDDHSRVLLLIGCLKVGFYLSKYV